MGRWQFSAGLHHYSYLTAMERFGEAALDILGMRATLSEQMPDSLDIGRFEQNLYHAMMWVISIGTNEVQRSPIAQRCLSLPK